MKIIRKLATAFIVLTLVVLGLGLLSTKRESPTPAQIDAAAIPSSPSPKGVSQQVLATAAPGKPTWAYSSERDEMRGVTNRWANLDSENKASLKFPYSGGSSLSIVLRDMPKQHGKDILLSLSKGQINCMMDGCKVLAKFDDGPIVTYTAIRADGGVSNTVFIRDHGPFLSRLRKAEKLILEVPLWDYGPERFTFKPAGLDWK